MLFPKQLQIRAMDAFKINKTTRKYANIRNTIRK